MTRHEYTLVDVFTDRKFGGNQLAVFRDGRGVDDRAMQTAAKELNLPETTFVVPPEQGGDHRLRIFTPARELPFAGHPTVGTAFVLADGRDATLKLEERATGSATGPLGASLVRQGLSDGARIVSERGYERGRPSLLYVRIGGSGDAITGVHVGGRCATAGGGWRDL